MKDENKTILKALIKKIGRLNPLLEEYKHMISDSDSEKSEVCNIYDPEGTAAKKNQNDNDVQMLFSEDQ